MIREPGRSRGERGFTSVWVLGLSMMLLIIGLAVIDAWRVYAMQRQLTARADAASAAGAQGINTRVFEDTGTVALEGDQAHDLAWQRLRADVPGISEDTSPGCTQEPTKGPLACISVANPPDATSPKVTIRIKRSVEFTVFAILGKSDQVVSASSTASPQLK